jgi:hypothetical protein
MDRSRFAKTALLALMLGAAACDDKPGAKTAADQKNGDGGREGMDRSGSGDKSHCAGDEKH